jgi:hypothetical protein
MTCPTGVPASAAARVAAAKLLPRVTRAALLSEALSETQCSPAAAEVAAAVGDGWQSAAWPVAARSIGG